MNIRILSFNIHKGVGWLTRKPTLDKIISQLSDQNSDVIFLQEIRGFQYDMIKSEIWPYLSYGKNVINENGHHGNAILSKFPVQYTKNIDLSMNRYERRGLLHSIVKLEPYSRLLHLLCVHLGLFESDRRKQLKKIIDYIEETIADDEPLILAGDFNDWSGFATGPLVKNFKLNEVFLNNHGRYARTFPAWAPLFPLDRIYLRGFKVNNAQRLTTRPWRFLSDHIAIEADARLDESFLQV